MATTYKVIAQAASTTSMAAMYTVPASTSIVGSSIVVCNRSTTDRTFQMAVRPDGETLANKHYLFFDMVVYAKSTLTLTLGLTADAGDVIDVSGSSTDLSFTLFGSIIS